MPPLAPDASTPREPSTRPLPDQGAPAAFTSAGQDPTASPYPEIEGYRVTGVLGRGARSLVYQAEEADGHLVALKVMSTSATTHPEDVARFHREGEIMKRLRRHPNIVTVYKTGTQGPHHFLAMELVPGGRTLKHRLHEGRLPPEEALPLAIAAGEALAYAHQHDVIHRDFKPSNILLNEFGQPLLADFGLAKSLGGLDLTLDGQFMGTPRYMSPEQARPGARLTPLADQYSFGVVLYEMLTGALPYPLSDGQNIVDVLQTIQQLQPALLRPQVPAVSRDLEAVVLKLLEKDPAYRYPSMAAAVADLEACRDGRRVSVRVPSWGERIDRWALRHPVVLALGALSLITAGVLVWRDVHSTTAVAEERLASDLQVAAAAKYQAKAHAELLRKVAESELHSARVSFAAGQPAEARRALAEIAVRPELPLSRRLLAGCEEGVLAWLGGERESARTRWAAIAAQADAATEEEIDEPGEIAYIAQVCRALAAADAAEAARGVLMARKDALGGLGRWALALYSTGTARDVLRQEAIRLGGTTFTWMQREIGHEPATPR